MLGRIASATRPPCTLTASGTSSPASACTTERATARPAFSCASWVLAPRWGVATTVSRSSNGESGHGSSAKTSTPAAATRPSLSAACSATSSTMPPREALTRSTEGLTRRSSSAPTRPRVSGVRGRWTVMTSAVVSSVSRSTIRTPSWAARPTETYGSCAMTCIPNAASRCATRTPTRPRPSTPTVLPASSVPVKRLRSHSPSRRAWCACGMWRAAASSSPTVSSAAETRLAVGAVTTMTPAAVAARTSMVSSPVPARATTRSRGAAASTSASTRVPERTIRASASATAASSPARSVPSQWRTSKPSPRAATVAGLRASAMSTTGWRGGTGSSILGGAGGLAGRSGAPRCAAAQGSGEPRRAVRLTA